MLNLFFFLCLVGRFRSANSALEAENAVLKKREAALDAETRTLRADNVKMYEKIKFLESYRPSSSAPIHAVSAPSETHYPTPSHSSPLHPTPAPSNPSKSPAHPPNNTQTYPALTLHSMPQLSLPSHQIPRLSR